MVGYQCDSRFFLSKKENCTTHSKSSKEICGVLGILEENGIEKGEIVMINRVTILYLANNRGHEEGPSFAWVVEYE